MNAVTHKIDACIAGILLLVSANISFSAAAPFKLIVGYAALNARISPLWLAEEQGYLAKYGLQVEQVYLRGARTLVPGLASGDIQLGRSGGSATLAAIGAGHDFKIVATFSSRNTYDFIARPNIKRAEELRGKKIGRRASAAPPGWACCSGSSISASIRSATIFCCKCLAIRTFRPKPSKPASPTPLRSMAFGARN